MLLDQATTWRIHDRAECALLIDGRDYYRAFYAAAQGARRSILLLGWQFDTDVELLRGGDLPPDLSPCDVELLSFLARLCRERPELEVRILAWDHSMVFALEREALQKVYFDVLAPERFVFRWDDTAPMAGSQHQKVAVIDGRIGFFGSQDICQARWDDSEHLVDNDLRRARGTKHQPYHEVQVAVSGPAARSLVDLFVARWQVATGEVLAAEALVSVEGPDLRALPATLSLPAARLGLARTVPASASLMPVREVAALLVRAIERAEHTVYIETQYLTSRAVRDALVRRMADHARPRLDIVIVLPRKPEKLKEELTVGTAQVLTLRALDEAARQYGHALGVYHVRAGADENGDELFVYIHSKLLVVDDALLVVGSANLTNRSLTIDSELVAAYEGEPGDERVARAIRRVRTRLLHEHVGEAVCVPSGGLVAQLDALSETKSTRLRRHEAALVEPSLLARAVHEITADLLDPWSEPAA